TPADPSSRVPAIRPPTSLQRPCSTPAPVPKSEPGARDSLDRWDDMTCIGNRRRRRTGGTGQREARNGPDLGDLFLRRRYLHDAHPALSN
ncbi:hypothetical protein BJY59DRAFT_701520, partial [Rhodotorula toruloides]